VGGSRTPFSGGFLAQREDQHNAIANGNPHCPKRRPAANHVIKTRAGAQSFFENRFLTIEGSPLELCYIPYLAPARIRNVKSREAVEISR
jgi:hypothetical protein